MMNGNRFSASQTKRNGPFFNIAHKVIKLDISDDSGRIEPALPPKKKTITNTTKLKKQPENEKEMQLHKAQRDDYLTKIAKLKNEIEQKKQRNEKQKAQFNNQLLSDNERIRIQEAQIQKMTNKAPDEPDYDYNKHKFDLQEKIDQLTKEKEAAEIKVDQLGRALIESQQRLKDAKEKVKSLPQAGNIELLQKAKRQLERERDSKITYYKNQINEINEKCQDLNSKVDESVKKGEQLQQENEELSETYAKLEQAIRNAQKKYNMLKQQVDSNGTMVTPEYVQKKLKEAEDLKSQTLKQKRKELETKYEKALNDQKIMQEDLESRNTTIEQLNQKITQLTQDILSFKDNSQQEIKALMAQHKQNVHNLKNKLRKDLEDALQNQREKMMAAMQIAKAANH